jgi:Amidohydrolase
MLRHSIDKWGADHVLLGTDYPYDMGEVDPLGLISRVPRLSAADRDLVSGGNAMRLLGIRPPAEAAKTKAAKTKVAKTKVAKTKAAPRQPAKANPAKARSGRGGAGR